MHFDWTLNIGNIVTLLGVVTTGWVAVFKIYSAIDKRLSHFEQMLQGHAETLVKHASKMDRQDDLFIRLLSDVQRLMGRFESRT